MIWRSKSHLLVEIRLWHLYRSHDQLYQKLRGKFVRVTEKIKGDMSGVRRSADEIEKIVRHSLFSLLTSALPVLTQMSILSQN